VRIDITPVRDWAALGATWRELEARAAQLSFFQSWSWVGCLAEERFTNPVLLRASDGGTLLGLALFNRHRGRLHLTQSGDVMRDAAFIEHNAPLTSGGPEVTAALLQAAADQRGGLVLDGVPPDVLALAPGIAWRYQERLAPWLDLAAVRARGGDHLAMLSANTRYQIGRSVRQFESAGRLVVHRAESLAEAESMLGEMIVLHERVWQARGKPGAFAHPFMRRFHAALLAEAVPRGEVDLLRVQAGPRNLGILYNFRLRQRISAYQSGFNHSHDAAHGKPGLCCHVMAIKRGLAQGDMVYDFLGGADRYKRSLAGQTAPLLWAEMVPRWSPRGLLARISKKWRSHLPMVRNTIRGSNASGGGGAA